MTLQQHLNIVKNKIGLVSGSLRVSEYDDAQELISASIDPDTWNINISLRTDFNPIQDRRQRAYARKKSITDGKKTVLEDILHHELAHWEMPFGSGKGCPFDIYHHDLILEAVKKELPQEKKNLASYITNMFEDLMINPRVKEYKGDFSGQVLFWDQQGISCKAKGQKGFTPLYQAFVELNMHLFGDNADRSLLKRYGLKNEKVEQAVAKVIQELHLPKAIQDTAPLFVQEQWSLMAERFTRSLLPLLDQQPTEKLSAFSASDSDQKQPAGNGLEQKLGTKEGKEEVAYQRYAHGKPQSPNITSHEQLDALYQCLARAIPVKVEAMTRQQSLPIAPLTLRPFDEDTDDPRKARPKLYLDDEGKLTLGYQRQPLTVVEKAKIQRRSFPSFKMIMLDNSESMQKGIDGNQGSTTFIPWGDNSKYHFALLGFYGIERFLQEQGIAQYIDHGLSLFSSSTRYSEGRFQDLHQLRKLALAPEFGETALGIEPLVQALQGKESFVLSLSDGEIQNWDKVKKPFLQAVSSNHFAHIQIGNKNKFTENLEAAQLPVFYVTKGSDLAQLMVTIATDTYKRFTHETS